MRKFFQDWSVPTLRHLIRRLRKRAILFKCHHFNTRRTKQDLVTLMNDLFYLVRAKGLVQHYHHRNLVFDFYAAAGEFWADEQLSELL